jgi:hypothetical protein
MLETVISKMLVFTIVLFSFNYYNKQESVILITVAIGVLYPLHQIMVKQKQMEQAKSHHLFLDMGQAYKHFCLR